MCGGRARARWQVRRFEAQRRTVRRRGLSREFDLVRAQERLGVSRMYNPFAVVRIRARRRGPAAAVAFGHSALPHERAVLGRFDLAADVPARDDPARDEVADAVKDHVLGRVALGEADEVVALGQAFSEEAGLGLNRGVHLRVGDDLHTPGLDGIAVGKGAPLFVHHAAVVFGDCLDAIA